MARLLDRMRVGTKLTLIALAYTVPIGILLLLLVREQNVAIDFATREREGGRYLSPLVHALSALSTRASQARDVELASARVEAELARLATIDSELGATLQTDTASLSTKDRSQLSVSKLQREWEKVKTSTNAAREPAVAAFVTNLRSLVAHIGDTSNLILDPDLDTYYTMDATLLRVPEALELLPRLTSGLRATELTDADKHALLALLASLRANQAATKGLARARLHRDPELRQEHHVASQLGALVDCLS